MWCSPPDRTKTRDRLAAAVTLEAVIDAGLGELLSADVARNQSSVEATYDRKIARLVQRIADLLEGERPDREHLAWSVIGLMVGAAAISRGLPAGSRSRTAVLDSVRATVKALTRCDFREEEASR